LLTFKAIVKHTVGLPFLSLLLSLTLTSKLSAEPTITSDVFDRELERT